MCVCVCVCVWITSALLSVLQTGCFLSPPQYQHGSQETKNSAAGEPLSRSDKEAVHHREGKRERRRGGEEWAEREGDEEEEEG